MLLTLPAQTLQSPATPTCASVIVTTPPCTCSMSVRQDIAVLHALPSQQVQASNSSSCMTIIMGRHCLQFQMEPCAANSLSGQPRQSTCTLDFETHLQTWQQPAFLIKSTCLAHTTINSPVLARVCNYVHLECHTRRQHQHDKVIELLLV